MRVRGIGLALNAVEPPTKQAFLMRNVSWTSKVASSFPSPPQGLRRCVSWPLKKERSGVRFSIQRDEGKPFIELNLFHDTVPSLKLLSVKFELLTGVAPDQARVLVEAMNERIVGIVVTPK
jgi:hypothetical protein